MLPQRTYWYLLFQTTMKSSVRVTQHRNRLFVPTCSCWPSCLPELVPFACIFPYLFKPFLRMYLTKWLLSVVIFVNGPTASSGSSYRNPTILCESFLLHFSPITSNLSPVLLDYSVLRKRLTLFMPLTIFIFLKPSGRVWWFFSALFPA